MHYLVATDSVHVTAAACDYLDQRLDPDDTVTVLTVAPAGDRDAGDAANVARARLAGRAEVSVTTVAADDPADAIREAAADRDADVLVLGPRSGRPGSDAALGSTVRAVLADADRPAVVVPLADLE